MSQNESNLLFKIHDGYYILLNIFKLNISKTNYNLIFATNADDTIVYLHPLLPILDYLNP